MSPTVDDHPDHPIDTRPSATENSYNTAPSANQHETRPDRATASEHASLDHEDVREVDRSQSTTATDTSAARFLTNLFDQRGGSPLSGSSHPRSPGPMGTASYFGRTSSPPQFVRNPSNPPFVLTRDFPSTSNQEPRSDASSPAPHSQSPETKDTATPSSISHPPNSETNNTTTTEESHPASDQSKHEQQTQEVPQEPIYPTVIPAEYRERQARREAMIREQEQRSERTRGDSTDEHTVSA
jgi:hypothetical protein